MKTARFLCFCLLAIFILQGSYCRSPYKFTSGRQFGDTVTVSVLTFENAAPLAKATLPQSLTEAMKDAIQRQTRLQLVQQNGDLNYEGSITGYAVTPVAVQAGGGNASDLNRLTITVNIKYTDLVDPKFSFESSFSRYSDFPTSQNLTAVEDQLIRDISEQLVQDIMNKSINAW
jgi:hypothetical protein